MKVIISILLLFTCGYVNAQTAKAGVDQTIYLTQTSTVTLDGSASSGSSFLWTKIYDVSQPQAPIPPNPSVIVSPTSKTTTVTGLIQGTWYYELAATTGGVTKRDTVVIRVDYDVPPANSTLHMVLPIKDEGFVKVINNRSDTTQINGYDPFPHILTSYYDPVVKSRVYIERSRANGVMIDSSRGKLYFTLEDGYAWNNSIYARSQMTYTNGLPIDSNKTYVIEFKFYIPQSIKDNMAPIGSPDWGKISVFGVHGNDDGSGGNSVQFSRDNIVLWDNNKVGGADFINLMPSDIAITEKTHTIRLTIRQGKGYTGQKAFIKVEVDGVQKYYRNSGDVGKTFQQDYLKIGGLYDWNKLIVDPANNTRKKKFSFVMEEFRMYTLNQNVPPTVNAGADKTVDLNVETSVLLQGTATAGTNPISSTVWAKVSGPTGAIQSPTSLTTSVNGLVKGIYVFELTVTDNNGLTAKDYVTVSVFQNQPPVITMPPNRTIQIPTANITATATPASGETITSTVWSVVSGTGTFTAPNSLTTTVNGLANGLNKLRLTATQSDGETAYGDVNITVTPASSSIWRLKGNVKLVNYIPAN